MRGTIKIAVVSGIHYLDATLLQNNGQKFEDFKTARKHKALIEFSDAIFNEVKMDLLNVEKPHIVLIPGDLSNDGELVSHIAVRDLLKELKQAGMKVYVVPGRGDINNPRAFCYNGNKTSSVPTVTEADFKTIYSEFGYGNTSNIIATDPVSSSYVAEPYPGLQILVINPINYSLQVAKPEDRTGSIDSSLMTWIQAQMTKAGPDVTVLGLMHHNLIEHFYGQTGLMANTVVSNSQSTAADLEQAGLKVIFTGCSHANDISLRYWGFKLFLEGWLKKLWWTPILDIGTGSLVTYPSPYRILNLDLYQNSLSVKTKHVTSIPVTLPVIIPGTPTPSFTEYSQQLLREILKVVVDEDFKVKFNLTPTQAVELAPVFTDAFMAHLAGDEKIPTTETAKINALTLTGVPQILIDGIYSLWKERKPADNDLLVQIP